MPRVGPFGIHLLEAGCISQNAETKHHQQKCRTTSESGLTRRTLEHDQEQVNQTAQNSASHQYPYAPDVVSLDCDSEIEVPNGKLEKAVGHYVHDFTQVPKLS